MTNQKELTVILDALDAATWTDFETLIVTIDGKDILARAEILRLAPSYPDLDQVTRARLLEWITPGEIRAAAPELDLFLKRRVTPASPEPEPETDWSEAILTTSSDESPFNPGEITMVTEPTTVEELVEDLAAIDAELNHEPGTDQEEAPEALPEPMTTADLAEAAGDIEEEFLAEVRAQEEEPKQPWADFEELA